MLCLYSNRNLAMSLGPLALPWRLKCAAEDRHEYNVQELGRLECILPDLGSLALESLPRLPTSPLKSHIDAESESL